MRNGWHQWGNKRKVTEWGVITRVAAILFFPLVLYNVLQLLNQDTEYEKIIATMPDTGLFTQQEALVEYKVNTGVKCLLLCLTGVKCG